MKCERCGFDNPDYLEYCQNCSAPLAKKTEEASAPSWGFVKAPRWTEPEFSADTVSEDDVPADFVSESEALRRAQEEARIAREEARRAREEAEAAKAAIEAERAKLAAQAAAQAAAAQAAAQAAAKAAEEERIREQRQAAQAEEEARAAARRAADEARAAERKAEQERLMEQRRKAEEEEEARARAARRAAREQEDDDTDEEGGEGVLATIGGLLRRRDKEVKPEAPAREQNDFNDDYRRSSYRGGKNRSNVLGTVIKIAAVIAALAILAVAAYLIAGKVRSCNEAAKVPTVEANPDTEGYYLVTIHADEGDKLIYETPDGRQKEVTVDSRGHVVFNVPASSLMTVDPVEGTEYVATPKIYLQKADGSEPTLIEGIPSVTLEVPQIEVRYSCGDDIVSEDGNVNVSGHIDLIGTKLSIDGENVPINQDGSFSHDITYEDTGDYTIAIEGRLGGYQVYRHNINVTVNEAHPSVALVQLPWEYGDTTFSQRVKNSTDTIQVRAQAPAGSTIEVACDSSNAALSTPVVNEDGSFTFDVKMAYAGDYAVTITCTSESGQVSDRVIHVQRAPEYSTYLRGAWQMNYASFAYESRQGYQIKGTVTEILEEGDYVLAMLELDSGDQLVIEYHNHYGSAGAIEVGKSYQGLYGRPMGLNEDGIPQAYIWFVED